MKTINIAIDGHSSCGKSTIAKQLSRQLGYVYIDTGAMYRAVCLYALKNDIIKNNVIHHDLLTNALKSIEVSFSFDKEKNISQTILNGQNVEDEIRSLHVSQHVSEISKIKEVREKLVSIQKDIGKNKGVVMDGRDIGSVVFPDAELKLFVTASAQERARRRWLELDGVSYEEVLENLKKRDEIDSTRQENPLVIASDAIQIDTTSLDKEEQFDLILQYVHKVIMD